MYKGCEPLTPEDIAEVVVFNAGRRENVVIADTLIFPNHQVRSLTAPTVPLFRLRPADLCFSGWSNSHAQENVDLEPR